MKIKNLRKYVLHNLAAFSCTRESDFLLWLYVANDIVKDKKGYSIIRTNMSLEYAMINAGALGLPTFESVSRCRRKILEKYPDLESQKVKKARELKRNEFLEFVRELPEEV